MSRKASGPAEALAELEAIEKELRPSRKSEFAGRRKGVTLATLVVALTITTCLSMLGGFAFANDVIQQQSLSQELSSYGVSSSAVKTFPTAPTVQLTNLQSWEAGCTVSTLSYPAGTPTNYELAMTLGAGVSTCATGDVVEQIQFGSPLTTVGENVHVMVYTTVGAQSYSLYGNLTVNAGTFPTGPQLVLSIDYGTILPASGVGELARRTDVGTGDPRTNPFLFFPRSKTSRQDY